MSHAESESFRKSRTTAEVQKPRRTFLRVSGEKWRHAGNLSGDHKQLEPEQKWETIWHREDEGAASMDQRKGSQSDTGETH